MRFESAQGGVKAWLVLIGLSFLDIYSLTQAERAFAQTGSVSPGITIANQIRVAPASEIPLQIQLSEAGAIEAGAFLLIRGLPPRVTLSIGRSAATGIWAIPLTGIDKLRLALPADYLDGQSDINIALVSHDGRILAETRSTLIISPAAASASNQAADPGPQTTAATSSVQPTAQQMAAIRPERAAPPAIPLLSSEERDRLVKLLQKGDESLKAGNVTVARLFYQKAAEGGLAEGALALATTYDANELARLKVVGGIQPDPELAKKWYERAKELGSTEAATRLDKLSLRW